MGTRSSGSLYRKLSPGPGKPASRVAAHQRARLHGAMLEMVAEHGYDAVTVRRLARLAGVSSRTFYEHFEDKEDCLLATCELVVRRAARRVVAAQRAGRSWEEKTSLTFDALGREFSSESKGARLVLVDAFAAGPAAVERMRQACVALEALVQRGFAAAPDRRTLPPLVAKGIVAGVARVACARLLEGRERELPALAVSLMEWALCFRSESGAALERLDDRTAPAPPDARTDGDGESGEVDWEALADERALIVSATAKLATNGGFERLSVPGIRAAAGVSRKSVEAHFEDVTACFLAAHESLIRRAVAEAERQGATAESWPAGLHRALLAFCSFVARDPAFARLGFIEVFGAGTAGIRLRTRLIAMVVARLRSGAPADQRPGELAAEASVGGALGIIHHVVASGRVALLPRAAPTLSFLMLAPAIGAPAAVEAIRSEHERISSAAAGV